MYDSNFVRVFGLSSENIGRHRHIDDDFPLWHSVTFRFMKGGNVAFNILRNNNKILSNIFQNAFNAYIFFKKYIVIRNDNFFFW